ncbi:MAG: metallophosphoesterase [Kofleriaceae bacterium]
MRALLTLSALLAIASVAHAEPEETSDAVPIAVRGTVLLANTPSAWRFDIVVAPAIGSQIAALALSGLDVVAGRAAQTVAVLGDGAMPARWPYALTSSISQIPPTPPNRRIAAAYGLATFSLDASAQGLEMLELRVRYQDGVAAWLNGVEVARAALPRTASATAIAPRPHGPEWETFYIPVAPGLLRLGDNTLAIEVHPSGRRDRPMLEVELVGRRDRGIVRGPILAEAGATSARIRVETDPSTDCVLLWTTKATGPLDQRMTSAPGTLHSFALDKLPANSVVRYRVHAGATRSAEYTFHTQPPAGATIRIGIYGDVRGGHLTHKKLVDRMFAEPLDLVAVTGDMVLHGSDEADWQRFFAITQPLLGSLPYYPAVGNHDLGWDGADASRDASEVFALPAGPRDRPPNTYYYSYDFADVHLVFLDSNAYELRAQEAWLEADLAAARARKVRAILAFTHDGPYSRGYHRGNLDARTRYVPILTRHGVDMIFSGHDHIYQRGSQDGLDYVVTGGGGASLYAPSCGVKGKRACPFADGMRAIFREHHYLVLTIDETSLELCARKPDGRLLEKCQRRPLRRATLDTR